MLPLRSRRSGRSQPRDRSPGSGPIRTVFSVDGSLYQRWQSDLLAHSHRKVGQPGPLTRLCSTWDDPSSFAGETFWTEPFSPHPATRDDYAPYNKPAAILAWLAATDPRDESVLILDPDCVFAAPVTITVGRGRPVSQRIGYMDPTANPGATLTSRHCRRPALAQPIGVPTLIHRRDLHDLAPLWLAKTEAIRNDRRSRVQAGWTAEMWGYIFAAAELGLRHELRDLGMFATEDRSDRPIIHYCYDSRDPDGQWRWGKRDYRAWEPVASPPAGMPRASVLLIDLVNEMAAMRQVCLEA